MATPDTHGPDAPFSRDGAATDVRLLSAERDGRFESVLFEHETPDLQTVIEPDYFGDLNLDQVLDALTSGREHYALQPFFYLVLHDPEHVGYRHEVFRDLERGEVREPVERFAETMTRMREHLAQVEKLHHRLQQQAWLLDAIEIYCGGVETLATDLAELDLGARALERWRDYLRTYASSERFGSLASEARRLQDALRQLEYAVHIQGGHVSVEKPQGQPDYGVEVEATFARFQQGAVKSYLVRLNDFADMNHIEGRILDLVAQIHRDVFGDLARYCERNHDYLDPVVGRFDREIQFYLGYLSLMERFRAVHLQFCYPEVSAGSKQTEVTDTFDVALANKLVPAGKVVCNDLRLEAPERVFIVTGPNNGGKTTFARTFGQIHHLASLGLPVPGSRARLFLPDRIFTHFEKEEDIETLRGKFEDELVRVHEILDQASSSSVIVMNESFNSTTLDDARTVGGAVLQEILDLEALAVYVTFVDELASMGDATVSMVSQIVPDNPAERTFKVVRMPANGLAYAWAIAEKYGLTYDRLTETIPS
jgi:DNA mismatch repair protein MutS